MGFFTNSSASNGANQSGFSGKDKRTVNRLTRTVNRAEKLAKTRGTKATNKQGNKKTR